MRGANFQVIEVNNTLIVNGKIILHTRWDYNWK